MVQEYFNGKEPLQNINAEEIVSQGLVLSEFEKINIHDIITKSIGISIIGGKMFVIIPQGTVIPLKNNNLLQYFTSFKIKNNGNDEYVNIKIYEGNNKKIEENDFVDEIKIQMKKIKENIIRICMILNNNLTLKVIVKDKNNNIIGEKKEIKINKI